MARKNIKEKPRTVYHVRSKLPKLSTASLEKVTGNGRLIRSAIGHHLCEDSSRWDSTEYEHSTKSLYFRLHLFLGCPTAQSIACKESHTKSSITCKAHKTMLAHSYPRTSFQDNFLASVHRMLRVRQSFCYTNVQQLASTSDVALISFTYLSLNVTALSTAAFSRVIIGITKCSSDLLHESFVIVNTLLPCTAS